MPQTPTGITLGAYMMDPTLLAQQAAAQKQAMLAQLLANYRPTAIANPNPTGAFLQNFTASMAPALGAYLAGKSIDAERQVQQGQLAAQQALASTLIQGAGGGTPGAKLTPTEQRQMAAYGLEPNATVTSILKNLEEPEEIKRLRLMGQNPEDYGKLVYQQYVNQATRADSPNTLVTGPAGTYFTPSPAGPGVQHIMTNKGVIDVPIPGAASANAEYQYQQELGTGRGRMETTPATVLGPNGEQIGTTQRGAQGRVTGINPPGKVWDATHGIYVWAPHAAMSGLPAEPGPLATTTATEQAKTTSQIPQLQNKEFIEKTMPAVRTEADNALATINEIGILRNSPVATGPLTEQMKLPFAKLMALLHIDPGPLTDYQQFTNAIATRLYDIARDPAIRGPQTEGDAARFISTMPSLANTPQANAFIADYMQANAMRLMRRQQFYDQALAIKREAGATDLDDINRAWKAIDKSLWDYPIMKPWIKKK